MISDPLASSAKRCISWAARVALGGQRCPASIARRTLTAMELSFVGQACPANVAH
jgi:hypothetical protein